MLIYVIRHGQTDANADGVIQGWSDIKLNDNGRELAHLTGQALKGISFDVCISSPLVRAVETAQIVLDEIGCDIPIETDERIKEINVGDFELKSKELPELKSLFDDPFGCPRFPNGEDVRMVMGRTQEFLKEIIERDDGRTYLVSTHGCALRAMLNFLYEDKGDYWHGHVPYNCCVNIIEANGGIARLIEDDKVFV